MIPQPSHNSIIASPSEIFLKKLKELSNTGNLDTLTDKIKLLTINHLVMKTTSSIQILFLAFILSTTVSCGQKKGITITESVYIEENQTEVFEILRSFEKFPEWSPFLVTDPQQKNHVTGIDGQIGSAFHWEGVAEKSKGQQIISELEEGTFLKMACEMVEPHEATASFTYHIEAKENGTLITQVFEVPCSGFEKLMMSLFGVKKEMTETNQLGLQRLKTFAENN